MVRSFANTGVRWQGPSQTQESSGGLVRKHRSQIYLMVRAAAGIKSTQMRPDAGPLLITALPDVP
jgi:hypothetical protein